MITTDHIETIEGHDAEAVVRSVVAEAQTDSVCLTCSFQAEDMIVLHLLRGYIPKVPVLFLETGYHFTDTYQFRDRITQEWHLNLVNALPRQTVKQQEWELGVF